LVRIRASPCPALQSAALLGASFGQEITGKWLPYESRASKGISHFPNRVFFYNPTTKNSVWERPSDLVGRSDVTEMMKSPASAERFKGAKVKETAFE